ncbi:MAG TPA: two-component regulator propeller domain-containing protein [Verrucomicrobiae bacterium]|nr:two-component regulator propeller domain-containing protein [Verrucomicrobiae bacterium]
MLGTRRGLRYYRQLLKCHSQIRWGWRHGIAVLALVALLRGISAATPTSAGPSAGQPVVGRNANGVLEIFTVSPHGALLHRWQKASDGDWSAWSDMGGDVLPGIAVANGADGRMLVVAVDAASHSLKYISQRQKNGLEWSAWQSLGGAIRAPVTVAQDNDGRLEIFAVNQGSDTVQYLAQTNAAGKWSEWKSLGGAVKPELTAVQNRDGRLEVFAVSATSQELVHNWQLHPGASADWSGWQNLGGDIQPGFAVGRNAAGILEVFALNTSSAAVRISQKSAGGGEGWTSWMNFAQDPSASSPSITRDVVGNWREFGRHLEPGLVLQKSSDGRIEVFAVTAPDGALLHRWEKRVDGSDQWSQWASMGQTSMPRPAVGQNEDGNLEVFAVDRTNHALIHHRRQISSASDWLDWSDLDHHTLQYRSRTWQVGDGLPDNVIQAITQTSDGFLWAGTRKGLARFDGMEFATFDSKNTPALRKSSITALCATHDGALWIGSDGGGLVRMKNGTFAVYGKVDGLAGENVHVIYESSDGSLWIGTDTGLSRYQDGKFFNYRQKDGLLSATVTHIREDRDGNLWIATAKGLNRLRVGGAVDSFAMPNRLPNDSVRGICQDRGGRIWVGSNKGLLWYNWFWGASFYAYDTQYGLSDPFVSAICEDTAGNLWVGTYSGLNRFQQGRFFSQLDNEGLPFDRVNTLFEDRQGDLWVGTKEGLVRLVPQRFTAYTRQNDLTHNNVTSVLQDRAGNLWLGTWGGGLDELRGEKVTAYRSTNGLSQDLILSLCEGKDGSIWAGADFDGGLLRLKDGKENHYTWKDGLPNAGLRVLHEDSNSNLWIGTSRGLACFKNGKFTIYTKKDGLAGNVIKAIHEDARGKLWVGTEGGLSCFERGQIVNYTRANGLSDTNINAVIEDAAGNLWVGTESGGLNRFHDGGFTAYTTRDGLFSDQIFSILDDHAGWLWMSSSKGVFRARKADLDAFDAGEIKSIPSPGYDKSDGMESPLCNNIGQPAGWRTSDGRLWFPTTKGVVSLDPAAITRDAIPPVVYIREIIADRKQLLGLSGGLVKTSAGSEAELRAPPGRGEVEFQYAALNLSAPQKSRFRYRLEGIDSDWVDAGARRAAYYNNLPPGHYKFHVSASNADGVWNRDGASISLVLLPHYWQTWWFRAFLVLLTLGTASGIVLYVTRSRMQRKLNLLNQRHAIETERGRIAKDIHDDLGSSLTRILMLGERAEEGLTNREDVQFQVHKIVDSARRTIQALDEIVWAVNPESDTLDGLVGYITHYADEFFESTGIRCRLEIPVDLPSSALSAELRHNLFLLVKEAFNNVVRHSRAETVTVSVSANESTARITISDDGCGFDPNAVLTRQNCSGVANMRDRMRQMGGEFQVLSRPGGGTRLEFSVPVEEQHSRP